MMPTAATSSSSSCDSFSAPFWASKLPMIEGNGGGVFAMCNKTWAKRKEEA